MNITMTETVNFYGDELEIAFNSEGAAYVALGQLASYLAIDMDEMIEHFSDDPNVKIEALEIEDARIHIIDIRHLNGLLLLIPNDMVKDNGDTLMLYKSECFDVLHDYWMHGIAINRRENPSDFNSKFKDERAVSRAELTKAIALFYEGQDPDGELGLKHDMFDKVLELSYVTVNIEPKHEYEKLTGVQAKYLSWVESTYARVITKFAKWGELPEDLYGEMSDHVAEHLDTVGKEWMVVASNVPKSLFH